MISGHLTSFVASSGQFTYTPQANLSGSDQFTFRVTDGELESNDAVVTVVITSVNDLPVAQDDRYTITTNSILTASASLTASVVGLLNNDSDVEHEILTATLVQEPLSGSLSLVLNGGFVYTPPLNAQGLFTFTYQVSDSLALSNLALVTIAVVNTPPVARTDDYTTVEDILLTIEAMGVLSNDDDVEGDMLSATLSIAPLGQINLAEDGSFTYTPPHNFNGVDAFTYRAHDGQAHFQTSGASETTSSSATVMITVTAVDDPPQAVTDSYSMTENTVLTVTAELGVLANDQDVDGGGPQQATLKSPPLSGTLAFKTDGGFIYTPTLNFSGVTIFTYCITDGQAVSNIATVTINVDLGNLLPVAQNDHGAEYTFPEDTRLDLRTTSVLSNDIDPEGSPLTAKLKMAPVTGTLSFSIDGRFSYTPSMDYYGPVTFTYQANDGQKNSNPALVIMTVLAINDPPQARNDHYFMSPNEVLILTNTSVLSNDIDVDTEVISASRHFSPKHGQVDLKEDGRFVYTPTTDFQGEDSFAYQAYDTNSNSNIAIVTLIVGRIQANSDVYQMREDTPLVIGTPSATMTGVLSNDVYTASPMDLTQNTLQAMLAIEPATGDLQLQTNGSFVYTPTLDYHGLITFTYAVSATSQANERYLRFGQAQVVPTALVTIFITAINDKPLPQNDRFVIVNTSVATWTVLDNDQDVEDDRLTIVAVKTVSHPIGLPATATVMIKSQPTSIVYTPTANFGGQVTFVYTVSDGDLLASALITVVVGDVKVSATSNTSTTLTKYDGQYRVISITVPTGAISQTVDLLYTELMTVTGTPESGLFKWGNRAFNLSAYIDGALQTNYNFLQPVLITLVYSDTDIVGLNEQDLRLYFFNEQTKTWLDTGIALVAPDYDQNQTTFSIRHLTPFGLFGPLLGNNNVYLPLVLK